MRITTSVLTVIAAVAAVAWVAPSRPSQATVPAPVDCRQVKCVALTFDDGPGVATRQILRTLKKYDAKATFFVLGWVAKRSPQLVRDIHAAGHEVACHGLTHRTVYTQTPEVFRAETSEAKQRLEDATGVPVLGTVSMIVSDARKRKERRGLVGFLAGAVALLGSFGAGLLALFLLLTRAEVPRSLPVIYWCLMLICVGGSRLLLRSWYRHRRERSARRIAIYGAAYFYVHEVIIHNRFHSRGKITNRYLLGLVKAHGNHHKRREKEDGECFGMLVVPWRYFRQGRAAA